MAGSSFTNLEDSLAEMYSKDARAKVSWSRGALAAMLRKTHQVGKRVSIPIRNGNSPAVSATYADASTIADTGYTDTGLFQPAWRKRYGIAKIENILIAASQGQGGLFDDMAAQVDGVIDGVMNAFSRDVYGNGFGAIARVSSAQVLASTRLRLANPEDFVNFGSKNMQIQLSESDHGHALRDSAAIATVLGLEDVNLGYVTLAANLSTTFPSVAVGDYIFLRGDRENSASPTARCIAGLDAWLPTTVPTAVDETGVNRANDATLRGQVIDASSSTKNKEELIIDAVTASQRVGGRPDQMNYFTNSTNYKELTLLGIAKFRPNTVMGPYGIGFKGVMVQTDQGEIPVTPDRFCPVQRSYLLDMSTWKYYGLGSNEVPRFLTNGTDPKAKILQMTTEDSIQCVAGFYGQVGCSNPFVNVVVVHSTT